jgi:hypothetical protein
MTDAPEDDLEELHSELVLLCEDLEKPCRTEAELMNRWERLAAHKKTLANATATWMWMVCGAQVKKAELKLMHTVLTTRPRKPKRPVTRLHAFTHLLAHLFKPCLETMAEDKFRK